MFDRGSVLSCLFLLMLSLAQGAVAAPVIHSTERIELARDLVARAGWTADTLATSLEAAPADHAEFRLAVMQAVLFPDDTDMEALARRFQQLPSPSEGNGSVAPVAELLEVYDIWCAVPEQPSLPAETRSAAAASVVRWVSESLMAVEVPGTSDALAVKGYAGVLLGHAPWIDAALTGGDDGLSIPARLMTSLNGDGLLRSASLSMHHIITGHVLRFTQAIQESHPESFARMLRLVSAMSDPLLQLAYPDGLPDQAGLDTDVFRYEQALLFERLYALTQSDDALLLLDRLYRNQTRSAIALLIGPSVIPQKNTVFDSALRPQMGAGWLRSNDLSVLLNTGVSRYLDESPLLSVSFSSGSGAPVSRSGSVVIDGNAPAPLVRDAELAQNALITDYRVFPDLGTFIHATATGAFGERTPYPARGAGAVSVYERSLFLMDDICIDLFRVRGGETRELQLSASGPWEQQSSAPETGFVYSALAGELRHTVTGLGPGDATIEQENEHLILQQQSARGGATNFALVHQFHSPDSPPVRASLLPLLPQPGSENFQAIAILLETNRSTDVFFFSTDPSVRYEASFQGQTLSMAARMAHVRFIQGQFDSMRLLAGTELAWGDYRLMLDQPSMTGAVHGYDPTTGMSGVTFPHHLPMQPDLLLDSLLLMDVQSGPMVYQPISFVGGHQPVDPGPQPIQIRSPRLPDIAPKNQGVSMQQGLNAFYNHVAALHRTTVGEQPSFRILLTGPILVEVPANEQSNRIRWVESRLVQNFRGERFNDRIQFSVKPIEAVNGVVQVMYEIFDN